MKKTLALFLCLLLLSCTGQTGSTPIPTETPVPTVTPSPTETPAPQHALCGNPVKTLYVAGEFFDATGLYVICADGAIALHTELELPDEPLTAGMTEITLGFRGVSFTCPVTVVEGTAQDAFVSRVSEAEKERAQTAFVRNAQARDMGNRDAEPFAVLCALENPCPDGHVRSRVELVQYIDYHVFYGIESVIVFFDYAVADAEEEVNALYRESGLIAGTASVQMHDTGAGAFQILLRYYRDAFWCAPQYSVNGAYLTPCRKTSERTSFTSPRVTEDGVTVFTTNQAVYALTQGWSIAPVADSPAQALIERADEILTVYGDDAWTDMEKLYHVYLYFADHCVYDSVGDTEAGDVPDPELEPDLLMAQLVSFRADGPLLYGNGACYGFAKAAALLLTLEGFDVTRVVAIEQGCVGRGVFHEGDPFISSHSYLYVHLDGRDLLFDPTFAFAGTSMFGKANVVWYRTPCICLSCEEHRQVYDQFDPDRYAASEAYHPADGSLLGMLTYDGTHGLLVNSKEDGEAYLDAMQTVLAQTDAEYLVTTVLLNAAAFSWDEARAYADILHDVMGHDGYRYVDTPMLIGDQWYYCAMLTAQRD